MVRLLRKGALSAAVAVLLASTPVALIAAQAGGGGTTTGAQQTYDAQGQRNDDDGFDPGWFGLLGLAGLFGLRRPRDETRLDATPVTRRP